MKWMHRISALTLAVLLGACGGAKPAGEPGHEDESQAEAGGHEEEGHEEAMDRTTIAAKVALRLGSALSAMEQTCSHWLAANAGKSSDVKKRSALGRTIKVNVRSP